MQGNKQLIGNFLIGQPLGNLAQNFQFTFTETNTQLRRLTVRTLWQRITEIRHPDQQIQTNSLTLQHTTRLQENLLAFCVLILGAQRGTTQ